MILDKEELKSVSQIVKKTDIGLEKVSNAKELTEVLYQASVDQIKGLGHLSFPSAFILDEAYCLIMDVNRFMSDEASKDLLANLLRTMAENQNVIAIGLAYEAWMVEATQEESKTIKKIENHPKKLEALVVQGEWRYEDDYLIFGRVLRGKDRKIIDILTLAEGPQTLSGRFTHFFIPLPFPGEPRN